METSSRVFLDVKSKNFDVFGWHIINNFFIECDNSECMDVSENYFSGIRASANFEDGVLTLGLCNYTFQNNIVATLLLVSN